MSRPPTMRHLVPGDQPVRARLAAERLGVDLFDIYCMIEWGEIVGGPDPDRNVAVPAAEIDRVLAAGGAPNYAEVLRKYGSGADVPEAEARRLSAMHDTLVSCAPAASTGEGSLEA